MNSINLAFENPQYLFLLIPSFLIILFPFFRIPRKRRKNFKRVAPVILHLLIVSILTLILAGTTFSTKSSDQTVWILMDCSDSMENVLSEVKEKTSTLLDSFGKDAHVGVIAFGEDQYVVINPKSGERTLRSVSPNASGSDLDAALELSSSMFTADEAARIILLSDGKETSGSAETMAASLASVGVEIDVIPFETTVTEPEMQLTSVTNELNCNVGDTVEMTVELQSNTSGAITLSLLENSEPVDVLEVQASPGTNIYTLKVAVSESGSHSYRIRLSSENDGMEDNNSIYTSVTAKGENAVLLVSTKLQESQALADVLTEAGYDVTTSTSRNLPRSIVDLCAYDEIILLNVSDGDLPAGSDKLLEEYVSVYGRTVLAAGGSSTFQYGSMSSTAFEDFLPVEFELKESDDAESVALMLVLDCSSSMTMSSNNLTLAKEGAVKVIESMTDNDYIGIISFNSSATLQASLTQGTDANKETLSRVISSLSTRQGTYYTEALKKAYQELSNSTASIRHVIFLSDGNPSDRGYSEVVQAMAADGITVSTIGLEVSSSTLSSLASLGGGRYYYVSSARDLPNIMLSETEQVVVNSLITEETVVRILKDSVVTEGMEETSIPVLNGYIGLTAKEEADVLLATGENDRPILTTWTYGKGTAAVFSSDLTSEWSQTWFDTEEGKLLIQKICSGFVDVSTQTASMKAEIEVEGMTIKVNVQTAEHSEGDRVTASVVSYSQESSFELTSKGAGQYTAEVKLSDRGNRNLVLTQTNQNGEIVDYLITPFAVNYSLEYDAFIESGGSLLANLADLTGGIVTNDVKSLVESVANAITVTQSPEILLCVLAMILLLADIAIRKINLKDLKRMLGLLKK